MNISAFPLNQKPCPWGSVLRALMTSGNSAPQATGLWSPVKWVLQCILPYCRGKETSEGLSQLLKITQLLRGNELVKVTKVVQIKFSCEEQK